MFGNDLVSARTLVATTTGEPMQPARLYYSLPSGRRAAVVRVLEGLRCIGRAPRGPRWGWWHRNEAARLDFSAFAGQARPSAEPVILGIIDLPATGGMQITVRSFHRAVLAARFFGRRLVDPRAVEAEQAWDDAVARRGPGGVHSLADLETIAEELMNREVADVPMVEDLPLHPEEETSSYSHLETTLRLRLVRALEHSRGRTDVTLRRVIRDMVDRAAAGTRRDGDASDLYRVES